MNEQWVQAITIGGKGGTHADRTHEEQAAWLERVKAVRQRAEASLLAHGATAEDFRLLSDYREPEETFRSACRALFATLSADQLEVMRHWSRHGDPTAGTVIDIFNGLDVSEGWVRCYDEVVPVAEQVWP